MDNFIKNHFLPGDSLKKKECKNLKKKDIRNVLPM